MKSGEPGVVTFSTKVMMNCLAGPSFHEGNGSVARARVVVKATTTRSAMAKKFGRCPGFHHFSFNGGVLLFDCAAA